MDPSPRPGKKPKYKNVNIHPDVWEMVVFVATVRGQNIADYLRPLIEPQATADFKTEMDRVNRRIQSGEDSSVPPGPDA